MRIIRAPSLHRATRQPHRAAALGTALPEGPSRRGKAHTGKNLKAAELPIEQQLHAMLQEMWERYEPYADPDFRQRFARDVDGRFWEVYLGCMLLEAGCTLLHVVERQREGGQPDLCVLGDGRRIWIEAITPNEGDAGPDQIVRPVPINQGGGLFAVPMTASCFGMAKIYRGLEGVREAQPDLEAGETPGKHVVIVA